MSILDGPEKGKMLVVFDNEHGPIPIYTDPAIENTDFYKNMYLEFTWMSSHPGKFCLWLTTKRKNPCKSVSIRRIRVVDLLQKVEQLVVFLIFHSKPIIRLRECPGSDFLHVTLQAVQDHFTGVSKDLGHTRLEARVEAEHVVVDQ